MLKAYKYRLYPTKTQEVLLAKHFGCARYIYNYGLERKIKSYSETKKSVSRFTISADLPKLKKSVETKWLSEVSSLSLQAALLNLDMAFTRFFKERKGFPKFKSNRGLSYVIRCGRIFGYSHSLSAYVNKKYRHRVLLLNAIPCAVFRALLFVIFFRNDRMIYSRISP